ncbi:MAG: hypothetical protein ACRCSF_10535 [Mycobacteriaceae bacterium]
MKKITSSVVMLMLAAVAFVLTACSSGNDTDPAASSSSSTSDSSHPLIPSLTEQSSILQTLLDPQIAVAEKQKFVIGDAAASEAAITQLDATITQKGFSPMSISVRGVEVADNQRVSVDVVLKSENIQFPANGVPAQIMMLKTADSIGIEADSIVAIEKKLAKISA